MSYKVTTSEADQPKKCGCHCQKDTPQKDVSYNHETGEATVHPGNPDCPCSCQVEEYIEQYQAMTAAAEKAKEAAEEAKDSFVAKANVLDKLSKEATVISKAAAILGAIAGIHIDVPDNIATEDDITTAKEAIIAAIGNIDLRTLAKQGDNPAATNSAILEALSHISPEDPYSQALAAFFNITPPVPNAVPMTQQEVEDDLDELWNLIITQ